MKHYQKPTQEEHIKQHQELHQALDELSADFIDKTGKFPSDTTLMEFIEWSHRQTITPETEHSREL